MDPRSDELTFQQIDIEEHQVPNAAPQIRIWGVTATGHSVLVHVSAFLPYFYMHAPRGFVASDCTAFLNHLCVRACAPSVVLLRSTDPSRLITDALRPRLSHRGAATRAQELDALHGRRRCAVPEDLGG
jgi:hypothetical protein